MNARTIILALAAAAVASACKNAPAPEPYGAIPSPQQVKWANMFISIFCHSICEGVGTGMMALGACACSSSDTNKASVVNRLLIAGYYCFFSCILWCFFLKTKSARRVADALWAITLSRLALIFISSLRTISRCRSGDRASR